MRLASKRHSHDLVLLNDHLRGRRPNALNVMGYGLAKKIPKNKPVRDTWYKLVSSLSNPDVKNGVMFLPNTYLERQHPHTIRNIAFTFKDANLVKLMLDEELKPIETKRSLLRQAEEISNGYNSMRQLVSNGLGDDYGDYEDSNSSGVLESPGKRMPNTLAKDGQGIQLAILESKMFKYLRPTFSSFFHNN